jgi:hypothetical protein
MIKDGNYKERKIEINQNKTKSIIGTSNTHTRITAVYLENDEASLFETDPNIKDCCLIINKLMLLETQSSGNTINPLINMNGDNNDLFIINVIICVKEENSIIKHNIIKFKGTGSSFMNLENTIIRDINSERSIISLEDGRGRFYSCTFENINIKGDDCNGSVMNIKIKESKKIEIINGCLFKNCDMRMEKESNGGAIYGELSEKGEIYIENVTFERCNAISSNEKEGKGY